MISICRYTQDKHTQWDDFVKVSKNGTFLFLRAYMDYHSDRFQDHSLMFYNEKNRLILTATLIYRLIFIYGGTLSEERLSPIPLSKDFFS